jgi:hypothetical protein
MTDFKISLGRLHNMVTHPSHIEQLIKASQKTQIDNTNLVIENYYNNLLGLMNDYEKNHTIKQWFDLIEYVGVDPLRFSEKTEKMFYLNLQNRSIEDIQYFIDYAEKQLPNTNYHHAFEIVEKISYNSAISLMANWSSEEAQDIEKFSYFWLNQSEFIHSSILKSQSLNWTDFNSELTNLELLEKIRERNLKEKNKWYKFGYYNIDDDEMNSMIKLGTYLELQNELKNTTTQQKRIKI